MSILSFYCGLDELHHYNHDITVHIDTSHIIKHDDVSQEDAAIWAASLFRAEMVSSAKGYIPQNVRGSEADTPPSHTPPLPWYKRLFTKAKKPDVAPLDQTSVEWRTLPVVAVPRSAITITSGGKPDKEILFLASGRVGAFRLEKDGDLIACSLRPSLYGDSEQSFFLPAGEVPSLTFDAPLTNPLFEGRHPLKEHASYHEFNEAMYFFHTALAGAWMWQGRDVRILDKIDQQAGDFPNAYMIFHVMRLLYGSFFPDSVYPKFERTMLSNMLMDSERLTFPISPRKDGKWIVHQSVMDASKEFKQDWFDFGRRTGYVMRMIDDSHKEALRLSLTEYLDGNGGNTRHEEMRLRAFLINTARDFVLS